MSNLSTGVSYVNSIDVRHDVSGSIIGNGSNNVGRLYRSSGNLFIIVDTSNGIPSRFSGSSRSDVKCFSEGSSRRMRAYLRECVPEYKIMVTLTYPCGYPSNGKTVKEHLRRFIQEMFRQARRDYANNGKEFIRSEQSVFWFLEFQERGAPHFHLFSTFSTEKSFVSKKWYDIVDSEDPRHLQAGTRVEFLHSGKKGLSSYASKYAAKNEQKVVPDGYKNVGRFWGVSGCRDRMSATTFVSQRDMHIFGVAALISKINRLIIQGLSDGLIVMLSKNTGARVMAIESPLIRHKLFNWCHHMQAITGRVENFFEFAEISELE